MDFGTRYLACINANPLTPQIIEDQIQMSEIEESPSDHPIRPGDLEETSLQRETT
jgi:hypothetical protein